MSSSEETTAAERRLAAAKSIGFPTKRLCSNCARYNPYWRVAEWCAPCQWSSEETRERRRTEK